MAGRAPGPRPRQGQRLTDDFFVTVCAVNWVGDTKEYTEPVRPILVADKGEKVATEIP